MLPEWAQSEGIEPLLDRLQAANVSDIATSPYVMEPSDEGTREPPADAGSGRVRLLDRALWGRREIKVRTATSFVSDKSLYLKTTYQPPEPDLLTEAQGHVVADFVQQAKRRGLKVWFQVQSAIPPGYRVQFGGPSENDRPLGPDGTAGPSRVDANASLAAPDVLEYGQAMMKDLARAYPDIDGIRLDWPEYPPYHAHALFFDFNPSALAVAHGLGLDVDRMQIHAGQLQDRLKNGLDNATLSQVRALDADYLALALADYPGVADLITLRRHLALEMLKAYRTALPKHMALVPQTFPPPFHLLSGFDLGAAAPLVQGIGVKFYTMHWPMILSDYARSMSGGAADGKAIAQALVTALGTGEKPPSDAAQFHYPEPDEVHTASSEAITRKIVSARNQTGKCPVYAFTHAYGPLDDVMRRARACWEASGGKMWVNRYGYMSNDKISAFGNLVKSSGQG